MKAIEEEQIKKTVDSLWEMIEEDREARGLHTEKKCESSTSILANHFARYAENTLGNEIVIPEVPIWAEKIMPVLRELPKPEQVVVASQLAAELYSELSDTRWAIFLDGLPSK